MHKRHSSLFHSLLKAHISFARQDSTGTVSRVWKDDYVAKMAGREIPGYYFGESASQASPNEQNAPLEGDRSMGYPAAQEV